MTKRITKVTKNIESNGSINDTTKEQINKYNERKKTSPEYELKSLPYRWTLKPCLYI